MATEQKSKQKVQINPLLAKQGGFALDEARRLYDQRANSPLPSMYTGISPERQQALDQILATARGGQASALNDLERAEFQKVMSGGYLDAESNPYLAEIVRRSTSAAGAAPVSQFASAGRFGSGVMANAMQDAMQSTAAQLYGQNYQAERDRMMSMLGRGADVSRGAYDDAMQIANVGAQFEEDQLRRQAEAMRQYDSPVTELERFLALQRGNPLMGEKTMSGKTTGLDYGAMAAGGLSVLNGSAFKPT